MAEPLRYWHRAKKTVEIEQIYGERWLRWAYETPLGRAAVGLLFKRAFFSRWYGWRMDRRASAIRVLPFILEYGIASGEFARPPLEFATFNEFFCRALKKEARPIAAPADPRVAVLPADGRHLAIPAVEAAAGIYAKGQKFTLGALLADAALGAEFEGGAVVISRLCPVDYHRFHFPVAGIPGAARLINGWLYSVNPIALRRNVNRLVENKRYVTLIETEAFGRVAMLEIGATNVGTVIHNYVPGAPAEKGGEKGMFRFGGSCVVTVFARDRIRFDPDLIEQSAANLETYAKMGERLGEACG
jgi:phosphatidylserine decarboxylase